MGGAIGTDYACSIDGKEHRQILQRYIVDQLIVGKLKKAGVDGHHGFLPTNG